MTLTELFEQAKLLSPEERKELTKMLIDTFDTTDVDSQPKTGAEIVAMLEALDESIELLVDPDIEDPVEWVKAQRKKRQDKLKPYWDGDA